MPTKFPLGQWVLKPKLAGQGNDGSWRDYALVADIDPPRIVRALPSIGLLDIADEALAQACRQYLVEQGAQTFASFDEFKSAFSRRKLVPEFCGAQRFLQNVSRWQQVNTLCKINWLDFASVEWHLFRLHNEAKITTICKRK